VDVFEALGAHENGIRLGKSIGFASGSEHLINCFLTLLVPHLFKPAPDELLVLFRHGDLQ
jgi:hypothetical protein